MVRANPKISAVQAQDTPPKSPDFHDATELTLHVDIFSWTGFDEQ
jgi:hypothetical protein